MSQEANTQPQTDELTEQDLAGVHGGGPTNLSAPTAIRTPHGMIDLTAKGQPT